MSQDSAPEPASPRLPRHTRLLPAASGCTCVRPACPPLGEQGPVLWAGRELGPIASMACPGGGGGRGGRGVSTCWAGGL